MTGPAAVPEMEPRAAAVRPDALIHYISRFSSFPARPFRGVRMNIKGIPPWSRKYENHPWLGG